jgi:hypothetical protein
MTQCAAATTATSPIVTHLVEIASSSECLWQNYVYSNLSQTNMRHTETSPKPVHSLVSVPINPLATTSVIFHIFFERPASPRAKDPRLVPEPSSQCACLAPIPVITYSTHSIFSFQVIVNAQLVFISRTKQVRTYCGLDGVPITPWHRSYLS